jgi:hypothetical protein
MKTVKHVGRSRRGDKLAVVFRTLPGESDQCLCLITTALSDAYHDSLMSVIDSDQGQESFELGEILFIRSFSDGRPMLTALQQDGRLFKMPTDSVLMTPAPGTEIPLDQLNTLIAEQNNCAVDDLCSLVKGAPLNRSAESDSARTVATVKELKEEVSTPKIQASVNEALSDKDLAKGLRSQADSLYKEAARLRKQAEELDPTVKKSAKAKEEVSV